MTYVPDFSYEIPLWEHGYVVIGVDEVGRGCLAGPVFVGAVAFDSSADLEEIQALGINDSKKLSAKKRQKLAKIIKKLALHWHVSSSSVYTINSLGIVPAVHKAVRKGISHIGVQNKFLLLDAFNIKHIKNVGLKNQKAIIRGDQSSISIAAASIIAKVERDAYMGRLSEEYPQYFWAKNKGYGTEKHREAIKRFGKTGHHRDLFIRKVLTVISNVKCQSSKLSITKSGSGSR